MKNDWEKSSKYTGLPKDGTKVKVLRAGRKEESFIIGAVGIVDGRYMMPVSGVWVRFNGIVAMLSHGLHSVGFQGLFPADRWETVSEDSPMGFDGKAFLMDTTIELRIKIQARGIHCYCCGRFEDEHHRENDTHEYKPDLEMEEALKRGSSQVKRWKSRWQRDSVER